MCAKFVYKSPVFFSRLIEKCRFQNKEFLKIEIRVQKCSNLFRSEISSKISQMTKNRFANGFWM